MERKISKKKKISKKVVAHWVGYDPHDWFIDCMYRLMNNKVSVSDLRKEAKAMFKSYGYSKRRRQYMYNKDNHWEYLITLWKGGK